MNSITNNEREAISEPKEDISMIFYQNVQIAFSTGLPHIITLDLEDSGDESFLVKFLLRTSEECKLKGGITSRTSRILL